MNDKNANREDDDVVIDGASDLNDTDTEAKKLIINDGQNNAEGLLNLEELINNHIESIDKLKDELRSTREMFEDSFNNDPTYKENVERVKEVSKAKNSVRQQIAKQPSVAMLEQKVKDLRFDINESSKTLSDLLQDYKEQTGASEIETRNGQILEIVSTSRLVKRSNK